MEKLKFVRIFLADVQETYYDVLYENIAEFEHNCARGQGFYIDDTDCLSFSKDSSMRARVTGAFIPASRIDVILEAEMSIEEAVRRGYIR